MPTRFIEDSPSSNSLPKPFFDSSSQEIMTKVYCENPHVFDFQKLSEDVDFSQGDSDLISDIFAHIHNDDQITDTQFEGASFSQVAKVLIKYLHVIKRKSESTPADRIAIDEVLQKITSMQEIIEELNNINIKVKSLKRTVSFYSYRSNTEEETIRELLRETKQLADEIGKKVKALQPIDQSICISGGWKGTNRSSGHAMIYEFIKQKSGLYTIIVYNTGAGIATFHDQCCHGNKTKFSPVLAFKNIPENELFPDGTSDIFFALLYKRVKPESKYTAEDIYQGIFGVFYPYLAVSDNLQITDFISPQQAGTCTWRVLLAFMHKHISNPEIYKKIIFAIKNSTLKQFFYQNYQLLQQDTIDAEQMRNLLWRATHNVLSRGSKFSHDYGVNELSIEIRLLGEFILLKLQDFEKVIHQNRYQISYTLQPITKMAKAESKRRGVSLKYRTLCKMPSWQPIDTKEARVYLLCKDLENPQNIEKLFPSLLQELERSFQRGQAEIYTSQQISLLVAVEHIVRSWPIPHTSEDDVWNQIKRPEVLMQQIVSLAKIYIKAALKKNRGLFPKQTNTIFTLQAICHKLAIIADTKVWENQTGDNIPKLANYYIHFPGDKLDNNPYIVFFDKSDFERQQEIRSYFQFFQEKNKSILFDFQELEKKDLFNSFSANENVFGEGIADFSYYLRLYQHPLFTKKFKQFFADERHHTKKWSRKFHEHIFSVAELALIKEENAIHRPFSNVGLSYIDHLRQMVAISTFCVSGKLSDFGRSTWYSPLSSSYQIYKRNERIQLEYRCVGCRFSWEDTTTKIPTYFIKTHPKMYSSVQSFLSDKLLQPLQNEYANTSSDEKKTLDHKRLSSTDEDKEFTLLLQRILLRSSIKRELQPFQILYVFRDYLYLLEKSSFQALFDAQFFRRVVLPFEEGDNTLQRKHVLDLPDVLLHSDLQQQSLDFIQLGLNKFYHSRPSRRPNIVACMFFYRFAVRISHFLHEDRRLQFLQKLIELDDLVEKWLQLSDLTFSERHLLHLQRLHRYTVQTDINFTDEEYIKILSSWVCCNYYHPENDFRQSEVFHAVKYFMFTEIFPSEAFQQLIQKQNKYNEMCNQIMKHLQIQKEDYPQNWISIKHPIARYENSKGKAFWEINLASGSVYCETGLVKSNFFAEGWRTGETYKRLFAESEFNYHHGGNIIFFTDPILGNMRVVDDDISKGLQCHFGADIGWCQYIAPQTAYCNFCIPKVLTDGHNHWIPINNPDKIFITERTSKSILALAQSNGHIIEEETQLRLTSNAQRYLDNDMSFSLNRFERDDYILLKYDEKYQCQRIHFPRYISMGEAPLRFYLQRQHFVWQDDGHYVLCEKYDHKPLGRFENFILLQHRTDPAKRKILIPLQFFASITNLNSKGSLAVDDELKKNLDESFKGCYRYLEIDVLADGSFVTHNVEGSLFLAYIMLQQRRYKEALELIRGVASIAEISEISEQIIIQILHFPDSSSAAIAIILHTARLYFELIQRNAKKIDDQKRLTTVLEKYRRYLHNLNNIEDFLKLSYEEEIFVLQHCLFINDPLFLSRKEYLETHAYLSSLIQKVQRITLPIPQGIASSLSYKDIPDYPSFHSDLMSQDIGELLVEHFKVRNVFWKVFHVIQDGTKEQRQRVRFILLHRYFQHETQDHALLSILFRLLQRKEERYSYGSEVKSLDLIYEEKKESHRMRIERERKEHSDYELSSYSFSYRKIYKPSNADIWEEAKKAWLKDACGGQTTFSIQDRPKRAPVQHVDKTCLAVFQSTLKQRSIIPPQKKDKDRLQVVFPIDREIVTLLQTKYLEYLQEEERISLELEPICPEDKGASLLSEEAAAYKEAFAQELVEFQSKYDEGKRRVDDTKFFVVKDYDQTEALIGFFTETERNISKKIEELEKGIIELAKKKSIDPSERLQEELAEKARAYSALTIHDLIYLFLKGRTTLFQHANSHLTEAEISKLYQEMGTFLDLQSQLQQLQRARCCAEKIFNLTEKLKKSPHNENYILEREYRVQELALEMKKTRVYDPQQYPEFLVFEVMSNILIREEQMQKLMFMLEKNDKGNYKSGIIQMIMGGGKTSVLAALLLAISCNEGRIGLFLTPRMQMKVVSRSLHDSLRYLNIETIIIDYAREDLNLKNLQYIEKTLTDIAQQKLEVKRKVLIMAPEMVQTLDLEYKSLLLDWLLSLFHEVIIANSFRGKESEINKERRQKIKRLKNILQALGENCDCIGDEIDLLLSAIREVNFPIGIKRHVASEGIYLLREIFTIICTDTELVNIVGLRRNQQTLLQEEQYLQEVCPKIANILAKYYQPLNLCHDEEHRAAFCRYVIGKIKAEVDDHVKGKHRLIERDLDKDMQEDIAFVQYLQNMRRSKNEKDQQAAALIALTKHFLVSLLPSIFSKSGGRQYGRARGSNPSKVVPYVAVDTPATTEFAYQWEAIAYHFCIAVQEGFGITRPQIIELAIQMREIAEYYAAKERIPFDETPEAIEFEDLFGIALHESEDSDKIDEAFSYVNQDVRRALKVESETALFQVTYHTKRLSSTAQMLGHLLSTFRGFSGTLWNKDGYPLHIGTRCELDEGTETSIVHLKRIREMQKQQKGESCIHIVDDITPDSLLRSLYRKHQEKARIRGFLDAGGLFKTFDGAVVAKMMLQVLQEEGSSIDTIVFFHRPEGCATPDYLAFLRKGMQQPQLLEGSRPEHLEKAGLTPDDYFFYCGERHCTGTDLKQVPTAINFMSVDEHMLLRNDVQAELRLRQLFYNQDVEYIVPRAVGKVIAPPGIAETDLSVKDLMVAGLKNQSFQRAKDIDRSCRKMIDYIFSQHAIEQTFALDPMRDEDIEKYQEIIRVYRPFIESSAEFLPFEQFGGLERNVPILESLKIYAEQKLLLLQKQLREYESAQQQQDYEKIQRQVDEILAYAKKNIHHLPQFVFEIKREKDEVVAEACGVEILVEQEIKQEVEIDQELEQELLRELEKYEACSGYYSRPESIWDNDTEIEKFINSIIKQQQFVFTINNGWLRSRDFSCSKYQVFLLQDVLENNKLQRHQIFRYEKPYHRIFNSRIYVTANFVYATDQVLPVFHELQRPANQILVVKDDKNQFQCILLSDHEAVAFQKYLQKHGNDRNIWLIQPDKTLLVKNERELVSDADLERMLLEINIFNGNAAYLDAHSDAALVWLSEDDQLNTTKCIFLKLKVERNPLQRGILYKSVLLPEEHRESHQTQIKCEERLINSKNSNFQKEIIPTITDPIKMRRFNKKDLKYIVPNQVPFLTPQQITQLSGKNLEKLIPVVPVSKIDCLTVVHMPYITPAQFSYVTKIQNIQSVPKSVIEKLDTTNCHDVQLTQLKNVQITFLRNKDLIQKLPDSKISFVDDSMVLYIPTRLYQFLSDRQIEFVPIENLPFLSDEQFEKVPNKNLSKIRDPKLLERISNQRLDNIDSCMLPHLPDARLQYLTNKELIETLPYERLQYLKQQQFVHINSIHVPRIENLQWLQFLSSEQIKHLSKEQIQNLTDAHVTVIQKLTQQQLLQLPENLLQHLSKDQIHNLTEQAIIQKLSMEQVKELSKEQLIYLSNRQVQSIWTSKILKYMKNDQVDLLSQEQLQCIAREDVKDIDNAKLLQRLPKEKLINNISNRQVKNIAPQHVNDVLHRDQIQYLNTPQQLRGVKYVYLPSIHYSQLPLCSPLQRLAYRIMTFFLSIITLAFGLPMIILGIATGIVFTYKPLFSKVVHFTIDMPQSFFLSIYIIFKKNVPTPAERLNLSN